MIPENEADRNCGKVMVLVVSSKLVEHIFGKTGSRCEEIRIKY